MPISLPAAPDRYRLPDPPELLIRPTAGAEVVTVDGRSLPLVSATLRGTACGGLARLVLEQRFENRHDETLHVTYRMPLPVDGAVSGYAFAIAGRTITGRVQRKQEARERFERAIAAGHTAALLEQERGDIFTQSLGNLPAREALVARIAIDQRLAWLPEGEWELRFPTVIGPRYIAATDTAEDARATQVTTAPAGVAARIQIAIAIDDPLGGRSPSSPSHALAVGVDGVVELGDVAGARLDRDIVLRWPVAGAATGMSLAMMRREAGGVGDDCYGLVTIVPPVPAARPRSFARDLIVLIDTSGSMAGLPLDKAKQLVALLIESLGDDDQLELIAFSNEPRRYRTAPIAATRGEKLAAIRWLRGLAAGGGTEMRTAVIGALHQLRPGAQRQVVIATDGYIGGEAGLVGALHAGLPASCRLHFVGVGSSVNRSLAAAMARAGRGAEVICDLDGDRMRSRGPRGSITRPRRCPTSTPAHRWSRRSSCGPASSSCAARPAKATGAAGCGSIRRAPARAAVRSPRCSHASASPTSRRAALPARTTTPRSSAPAWRSRSRPGSRRSSPSMTAAACVRRSATRPCHRSCRTARWPRRSASAHPAKPRCARRPCLGRWPAS